MKTIKRVLSIVVMIPVFILLCGCNRSNNSIDNESKEIKIGVTVYKESDLFISTIVENLEKIAKGVEEKDSYKISLNVVDSNGSTINEANEVDKFIKQKYDVICVNLVDRTAASIIIDKAKAADIPIIFFNREPVEEDMQRWSKIFYVGTKTEQSGEMQADIILDAYRKDNSIVDKNNDGKIQYVILEGEAGHQDTSIRTEYCIKTLVKNGLEVEKLADDIANWESAQASEKMSQWIKRYDDEIEVVFSNNDDMALGAVHAYNNFNIDVENRPMIVGVDGIKEALESINNGYMTGTVISDSKEQAQAIFDIAYTLSIGGDIDSVVDFSNGRYIKVSHTKVNKENINIFLE